MSIRKCKCVNAVQDKLHGEGMRVMNATTKDGHRCTVCLGNGTMVKRK